MGGQQQEVCTLLLMGGQWEDTRHWACLAPRGCQRLKPQAGVLDPLDQVEAAEVQEVVREALEALEAQEVPEAQKEVQEAVREAQEAQGLQEEVLVQLAWVVGVQLALLLFSQS